jgi:hypothetical protein
MFSSKTLITTYQTALFMTAMKNLNLMEDIFVQMVYIPVLTLAFSFSSMPEKSLIKLIWRSLVIPFYLLSSFHLLYSLSIIFICHRCESISVLHVEAVLSYFQTFKMEAIHSSESSASFCQTTRRHIQEQSTLQIEFCFLSVTHSPSSYFAWTCLAIYKFPHKLLIM